MHRRILDIVGQVIVVSQITLHTAYKKGNRPSFIRAARTEKAIPLFRFLIRKLSKLINKPVKEGVFGADMKIALVTDGPVTIVMDSKNPE